ncbi:twin-arginine translocation pathway signal [Bradyrhizobium sp.]|uniref:twin-arginine translocation pathway signal n=1 Tax=Bradyrhizobium sp. TaxID=376 RepID=UPI0023870FD7|nr:twin-arginine translocation pathway signal [Bradyrhizobium sp.]MDE2377572.1 twin-arginine translocation pathway signal [Bradyrhizobium sp.]
MPVPFLHRLRRACALITLLASGVALSGCAGVSDTIGPAFADPARYELWDCKQLEPERQRLIARTAELQKLMDKAETGAGGVVVAEMAYRNEYVATRGQAHFAEEAWRRGRCREGGTTAAAAAPAPAVAAPAPASKSSGAVY